MSPPDWIWPMHGIGYLLASALLIWLVMGRHHYYPKIKSTAFVLCGMGCCFRGIALISAYFQWDPRLWIYAVSDPMIASGFGILAFWELRRQTQRALSPRERRMFK